MIAEKYIKFIEQLCLTEDYSSKKFHLRPWQQSIISTLYKEDATGQRLTRRCLLLLPRKQAKTTLCAALAVASLFVETDGQQIIIASPTVKQSGEMYRKVAQMIQTHPTLRTRAKVRSGTKRIEYRNSILQVLSSDPSSAYGYNPSVLLLDECLALPNKELYNVLTSCQQTRTNPLSIYISTAGEYDPESLLFELYNYAKAVQANPSIDPTFAPIIYEGKGDWKNEATWFEAMPALNDFCSLDFIKNEFEQAKILPQREVVFKTLYLNQFVSSISTFIPFEQWAACGGELGDNIHCVGGLDLSTKIDLNAFVMYFSDGSIRPYYWLPEEAITKRAAAQKETLAHFARQGFIRLTPGATSDYTIIREDINKLRDKYNIRKIFIDPWNAGETAVNLEKDAFRIEYFTQSLANLTEPTKELQRRVLNKAIRHNNHPVLNWQMNLFKVKTDTNGNLKPCKESSIDSIDGPICLIMAIAADARYPLSIYEQGSSVFL